MQMWKIKLFGAIMPLQVTSDIQIKSNFFQQILALQTNYVSHIAICNVNIKKRVCNGIGQISG